MNKFILIRIIFAIFSIVITYLASTYLGVFFPELVCDGWGCFIDYSVVVFFLMPIVLLLFFVIFDFFKFKESKVKYSFLTLIIFLVVYFIGYQIHFFLVESSIKKSFLSGYVAGKEMCERSDIWDGQEREVFCESLREEIRRDKIMSLEDFCADDLEGYFCSEGLSDKQVEQKISSDRNKFIVDIDGQKYSDEHEYVLSDAFGQLHGFRFTRTKGLGLVYSGEKLGEPCSSSQTGDVGVFLKTEEKQCVSTRTCDGGTEFCFTVKFFKDGVYYIDSEVSSWDSEI